MNFDYDTETITPIHETIPSRIGGSGQISNIVTSNTITVNYTAGTNNFLTLCGSVVASSLVVNPILTCKDNLNTTWTVVSSTSTTNDGTYVYCCYLENCPAGITSVTLTFTSSATLFYNISIDEWDGILTSSSIDQSAVNMTPSTNALNTGSITNVGKNDLIIALAACLSDNVHSWAMDADWSVLLEQPDSLTGQSAKGIYKIAYNNVGPFSEQFTFYGDNINGMSTLILSFKNKTTPSSAILTISSTDSLQIPVGTTAQRPGSPVIGQIRTNSDEDIIEGYSTNILTVPTIIQKTLVHRKRRYWSDEFITGSTAINGIGVYGELGWTQTSSGTPTISYSGVSDHPGIFTMNTGATSGNNARLHLGNAITTAMVLPNQLEYFSFLFRIPTITSITLLLGIGQSISSTTFGTNGVWFQFIPGTSATLQFMNRFGSTNGTAVNTVTVAANTWYFAEAFYTGKEWVPVVNGTSYTPQCMGQITTALTPGILLQTGTGALRTLDLDAFYMITKETSNRY